MVLVACSPTPVDHAAVVSDPDRSDAARARSLAALLEAPPSPGRNEALARVVQNRAFRLDDRFEALDALSRGDEQRAVRAVGAQIRELPVSGVADRFIAYAMAEDWRDVTPDVIRRMARLTMDAQPRPAPPMRSERAALTQLHDGMAPADVFRVLLEDPSTPITLGVDAWMLLVAEEGLASARTWLEAATSMSPLIVDLQRATHEAGVTPVTRDEVLWLMVMLEQERDTWAAWTETARGLPAVLCDGLMLWHLPLLVHGADGPADRSWLDTLEDRAIVHPRDGHLPPVYRASASDYGILRACDIAAIGRLDAMLAHEQLLRELTAQADADLRDPESEHGGLLVWDAGAERLVARPYAARADRGRRDGAFAVSERMRRDGYTALAQYHFHAQSRDEEDVAAPGMGDLRYAVLTGAPCIVFTPVGRDRLNVDFYARTFEGGVFSIDLGTLSPRSVRRAGQRSQGDHAP
jgi:hypothetical protein